jgi:cytochrome c oxidase cbb3-type subunit IV
LNVDIGTVRGLVTLALMLAFIGLVVWAWSSRRKAHFDEMARVPLQDAPQQNKGAKSDE